MVFQDAFEPAALQSKVPSEFPGLGEITGMARPEPVEGELAHAVDTGQRLLIDSARLVQAAVRASSRKVYYERTRAAFSDFVNLLSSHFHLRTRPPTRQEEEAFLTAVRDYDVGLGEGVDYAIGFMRRAVRLVEDEVRGRPLLVDSAEARDHDQRVARAYNAVFFFWHWTLMGLQLMALGQARPGSTAVGEAIVSDLFDLPRWANEHAMEAWRLRHPEPEPAGEEE